MPTTATFNLGICGRKLPGKLLASSQTYRSGADAQPGACSCADELLSFLAFRCDGDDDISAGHVARCLRLAEAFRGGGTEVLFVGRYAGVAAELLTAAGLSSARLRRTS